MTDQLNATGPSSAELDQEAPRATLHLFASDVRAPLHRRPVDVWRFAAWSVTFVLLGWAASVEPPIDERVASLFESVPGWISTLAWVGYSGSALAALGLVIACIVRGGIGRGIVRDLLLTLVVGVVLGLVAGRAATGTWPNVLPEFLDTVGSPSYPPLRPAIVVAVILVLSPYLTASVRRLGWWVMVIVAVSPILLGLATLTGALGSVALGALCVAAVRTIIGSPEGLPPLSRLSDTLRRVGVTTTNLAWVPVQPTTVGLATATDADGRLLSIKVYGRDARDRQRAQRVWKSLWYRSSGPAPSANPVHRVEHEGLAVLRAAQSGLTVPQLIRAGQDESGDVVLVTIEPDGTPLADTTSADLDDESVGALWGALGRLHDNRQTHGGLDARSILLRPAGPAFVDFGQSSLLPTPHQYGADIASMLAVTAVATTADRAVDGVVGGLSDERLVAALPYIQDAVVEPGLRTSMRHSKIKLGKVRDQIIDRLGIDAPDLAEVKKVKPQNIVGMVFAIFAAWTIISQIAEIGFDTLGEQLAAASAGWLLAAFLIRLCGYSTPYIGLKAVVSQPVPFGPSVLEQSANSYVGLVVPSTAGRVAMDTRFLQKLGVPTTTAITQGPVISFVGFLVEVGLLLLTSWALGQAIDTGGSSGFGSGGLLWIAVAVVAIGVAVIAAVPKIRNKVWPPVKAALSGVASIVTSPSRLGKIALSELLERLVSALALAAVIAAFGESIPFAALIFVTVGTSLLAGLAPVPGGVGVAEATMTALLTAVGMSSDQAFSIAITYRLLTSYLPPLLGFFSLRWLKEHGYI